MTRTHSLLAVLSIAGLLLAAPVSATVITYEGSSSGSLQELINSSTGGDTILVPAGKYPGSIVIDRPLTLAALDRNDVPELVASPGAFGIKIITNGVVIDGFAISGNGTYGLFIRSDNNKIYNTSVRGFENGIALFAAVNNEFLRNSLVDNRVGILADHDSQANTFSLNQFDNTENVRSSSSDILWSGSPSGYQYEGRNLTGSLGNYWKSYSGMDANNDGIGDMPYRVQSGTDISTDDRNVSAFVDPAPLMALPAAYTLLRILQPGTSPFGNLPGGLSQLPAGFGTVFPSGPTGSEGTPPGQVPGPLLDLWWVALIIVGISAAGGILFERARRRKTVRPEERTMTLPEPKATVVHPRTVPPGETHTTNHYAAHLPPALEKRYPGAEYVAEGGASRVFRSCDAEGRPVAVKVPIRFDEITGTQFTKELHVWQGLHHKNIVEIYAANIFPVPYIEMEYVESSLAAMKFPLGTRDAVRIIRGVAEGLRYANDLGIVHRDIKPGNILIAPDGTPKITDWGLAKAEGTKQSGIIGFSLEYASPEQLAPNLFGEPGTWTDIYQLGVLLYEMLSGKVPFKGGGMGEVTHAIIHDEPLPLPATGPETARLGEIIRRCLRKNPRDRYHSIAEIIEDLGAIEG